MVSHNAEEDEVTTIARSPVILTSVLQSNMPSSKTHRSRISITDLIDQRAPVPVAATDLNSERKPSPSYYESTMHSSIVSARSGHNVDDYTHDVCQQSLVGRQVKTSAIRHSSVSYGAPYRTAMQVFPTTGSAKSESTFLSTARSRKAKTTNFPLPSANCPITGRDTNAKVRDLDDRKNYYYGQQRYTFQQMSYTPREQTLSTQ
ncbi:hypothetical protein V1524DRAFT_419126 [Lipomyces starkeyi]